jgi:hypothetical protein
MLREETYYNIKHTNYDKIVKYGYHNLIKINSHILGICDFITAAVNNDHINLIKLCNLSSDDLGGYVHLIRSCRMLKTFVRFGLQLENHKSKFVSRTITTNDVDIIRYVLSKIHISPDGYESYHIHEYGPECLKRLLKL